MTTNGVPKKRKSKKTMPGLAAEATASGSTATATKATGSGTTASAVAAVAAEAAYSPPNCTNLETLMQAVEAARAADASDMTNSASDRELDVVGDADGPLPPIPTGPKILDPEPQPKPKRKRTRKPKVEAEAADGKKPGAGGSGKKSSSSSKRAEGKQAKQQQQHVPVPLSPPVAASVGTAPHSQLTQQFSPADGKRVCHGFLAPTLTPARIGLASPTPVSYALAPQPQFFTAAPQPTSDAGQVPYALAPHPQFFAAGPHPIYGAATVAMPTPISAVTTPHPEAMYHDPMSSMPSASILFQGPKLKSDKDGTSEMDRIMDIVSERDDDGDTCLHMAVVHGKERITRQLLEAMVTTRTNVDPRNKLYQTPLHIAVITGETQIVRDLVLAGGDVNLQDRNGRTAAHLCCMYHNRQSLRVLGTMQDETIAKKFGLTVHKLDTSIRDYEGNASIHFSVIHNDGQALNILLELNADIDEKDGTAGRTALHLSVELQNLPISRYLVDAGANVNAVNYAGNSPLHTAAGREHKELVSILMAGGADPTMVNGEGDTAKDICRDKDIKRLMNR